MVKSPMLAPIPRGGISRAFLKAISAGIWNVVEAHNSGGVILHGLKGKSWDPLEALLLCV